MSDLKFMKKIFAIFVFIFSNSFVFAQNVNIPDINFKHCLINNPLINTNGDNEIQVSEATAFTGYMDCSSKYISSLQGIEAFTNITGLNAGNNKLTSIDISQNINLESLSLPYNQLTELDVSKNTKLTSLVLVNNKLSAVDITKNLLLYDFWIDSNMLTNIDLSKNIALKSLYANKNHFTNLDLSNNLDLGFISCGDNQIKNMDLSKHNKLHFFSAPRNNLTSLNFKNGANTLITYFNILENPDLTCVQVDDTNYSTVNWTQKDSQTSYNTDCLLSTAENGKNQITIHPNPVKDYLYLSKIADIELYNSAGHKIKSEKQVNIIDVSKLSKGIYFIILKENSGAKIYKTKFVKE